MTYSKLKGVRVRCDRLEYSLHLTSKQIIDAIRQLPSKKYTILADKCEKDSGMAEEESWYGQFSIKINGTPYELVVEDIIGGDLTIRAAEKNLMRPLKDIHQLLEDILYVAERAKPKKKLDLVYEES